MGERGDIIRTMQRAMRGAGRPLAMFDGADPAAPPVVGRIAAKGLADELQDRGYLVVDGLDGRAPLRRAARGGRPRRLPSRGRGRGTGRRPRAAARRIARSRRRRARTVSIGTAGHLAEVRREARAGDDPDGFVAAHVRRLEALRRAGIVERVGRRSLESFPLTSSTAPRAMGRTAPAVRLVELRSHLEVRSQARAVGATWLDRALIEGTSPAPAGFGAEVREALGERRAFLADEGLATRRGQRFILARDLLATLRARDVDRAGATLAAETGLEHRRIADGGPRPRCLSPLGHADERPVRDAR